MRSVLVTGGSSGIGARLVRELLDAGDRVVVFDRDPPADSRARFVEGDVRRAGDHERAVAQAVDDRGRLDVLVANAGVHDGGLSFGGDLAALERAFRRVVDIDLVGYLLALGAAAAALTAAEGCAVLTLSDASFDVMGNGAGPGYVAAKHGGLGLLKVAARDLGPRVRVNGVAPGGVATALAVESGDGVRVNGVAPGGVATALAVESGDGVRVPLIADPEQLSSKMEGRTLLGRGVSLEEVVAAYLFLISDGAAGITGQVLRVDAGRLC